MGDSDRRVFPRTPITLLVEYPDASEMVQDYTANLSVGGTFVYTDKELAPGTPVDFVLSFPGLLRPIELTGVVRWAGTDPASEHRGVGIEFTGFDDIARHRIASLLKAISSGDRRFISKTEYRVLLLEDNDHLARLVARGLVQFGQSRELMFDVDVASDGEQALRLREDNDYDALVVDLYTPVLSGSDFIKQVRSGGDGKVPIIAISGGRSDEREIARAAGSDAFVAKPFRLRDLIAAVTTLLALPETRD
ncbi:MAG: TIGR02266 family protein [Deltaproteobacteria bacterium]|nr:TIGR02266 family protein [Deltaproteobacteria bacterium]